MSSNETTPFMFDIQESLSFRADAQLQDLIGIALEPEISIQEFEHEISVRGVIELTGEYYPLQEVAEGSAVAVSPGTREMENIEKQEAGTNTFYHRFPVEISVPKNRIKQLNDVYVTIDNFDYEVPGSNVLELHATVAIYGVLEERKQAQPQAPQQPYFPPPIPQAEQAKSYTDEIADQIEAQARDNQQYEQQGYQFAKEEPAEATSDDSASYATDEIDAEQQSYQISQDEYVEEAEVVENREETEADARDEYETEEQSYQVSQDVHAVEAAIEVNCEKTEADARDEYETEEQSYQFTQNEYPEEEVEVNREETEAGARDEYETEEQSYQFTQDVYAEEEVEVNKEETEADARDKYETEEQSYQFAQDYVEQKEAEVQDEQDAGGQGYQFSQEYTETEVEAELKAETRDQKIEEQSIPFAQEYAEQTQAEAGLEEPEASAASADYIEQRPSEEEQEEPQAIVQDQAPAYPKVTIQAEKPAENPRDEAVYEAEELSTLQNAHQNPEAGKLPEEFFVLPDELEDAYQAADFRQAHIQDDDVYYLDRELPHEEPSDTPDFTFTYQAKQEEAPPEPIRFEAPPLLTPEEDDRWKYKETKTFSEFFGSKPVEPTEVPQADVTAEEVNTEESYEDAYKDVSLQAVPINQELQPEDLPEVIEEEIEEEAERKDSSNFLVSMFGAREETYTKLRVCIVQERDTLEKIATRYDVPISSIASSNNLEEETVSEGQLLLIPQRRSKKN
ncbi:LysM peptidoglycan-binding domain-containing protein [Terribacillus saccharophilus]|uniref:LysM peptidoglycan-binding domain-containing protein n=1 Tax=Terribacillus saccharophilus TaxID=361277 RepID=UPI002DC41C63|nr:LysM peptidoglycan-binding domain-containing protein [Terribacillus saccharophilus]